MTVLSAVRFLTILPLGPAAAPSPAATALFPAVGLLVGLLAWALPIAALSALGVPVTVTAAVVLILDAVLTGGLHLDALADVADGVASRRRDDAAVAVMRDPAVGALGAATLVLACLLRFGLLLALIAGSRWPAVVAAPILGRAAMVLIVGLVPARQDSAATAFTGVGPMVIGGALALAAVLAWPLAGVAGVVALASVLALVTVYGWWWRRRFGALNGDGAGAAGFAAETAVLCVLVAWGV